MRKRRWPAAIVAATVVLALTGCFAGSGAKVAPAPTGPTSVYVALGSDETAGLGRDTPLADSWPQLFFRTALPLNTVFVNFGTSGATAADALSFELPDALAQHPTIATVWLNLNDLLDGVVPASYATELQDVVHRLRQGGVRRVLLANALPLDRVPALFPDESAGAVKATVGRYNEATARVAAREGAILVDLHALGETAAAANRLPDLVTDDGLLSAAGHVAVAKAFADALRGNGPPGGH
jgi:lysophospholipase L1-like esterase